MKKLLTLLVVSIGFTYFTLARTTSNSTAVLFNTAKHHLTTSSITELNSFLKGNLSGNDYLIKIEGHTDSRGDIAYNQQLSLRRAEQVKQYLIKKGVEPSLIEISYKGELDPTKPNNNAQNMQLNRRVEVSILRYYFEDVSELEEAISPYRETVHVVHPNQDQVIEGKDGVKILFRSSCFLNSDGTPVTEKVKVTLTEALAYTDFISSGLFTKSDNQLIESGGMLKVEAETVSGKPVNLDPNNPMVVAVPTANRQDDMEVFASNTGANWTPLNQPILKTYKPQIGPAPKMEALSIKLPNFYCDSSGRPESPVIPSRPRKPHEPRVESYFRPIPWYCFNKDKIKKRQTADYDRAWELYEKRLEKYSTRFAKYELKMDRYSTEQVKYKRDLKAWREKLYYDFKMYKQTPQYANKFNAYKKEYEMKRAKFMKAMAAWKTLKKEALIQAANEMDKMGIASADMMNTYVFEFNQLSWINCDRFRNVPEKEKQLIVLKSDSLGAERVLVMFKSINSMLPMRYDGEHEGYIEEKFPKDQEAVIFAYAVKDGKPYMCVQEINEEKGEYELAYQPTSLKALKTYLETFNHPERS